MLNLLKKLFGGTTTTPEAPYKVEAPVAQEVVKAEVAPTKAKSKPKAPAKAKAKKSK